MPGPGGGSHGGGGHRGGGGFAGGGFSGGGHRGGGFSSGHHTPHHHGGGFHGPHFGGGWHRPHYGGGWHRRNYGYGGGCLGSIAGFAAIPLLIIFAVIYLFGSPVSNNSEIIDQNTSDTYYIYDENLFQDYADKQYRDEFGSSTAYEDNILLVFLTESENYYDYYYIAWVGDHIDYEITEMFGNEYTEFGQYVNDNINMSSYKYSLDSNIAAIVSAMEDEIVSKGLASSFTCEENHNQVESHITNKSGVQITDDTVNAALQNFTQTTGISIVVVVDDIDEVFESSSSSQHTSQSLVTTVGTSKILVYGGVLLAVIVACVVIPLAISSAKKRKQKLEDNNAE